MNNRINKVNKFKKYISCALFLGVGVLVADPKEDEGFVVLEKPYLMKSDDIVFIKSQNPHFDDKNCSFPMNSPEIVNHVDSLIKKSDNLVSKLTSNQMTFEEYYKEKIRILEELKKLDLVKYVKNIDLRIISNKERKDFSAFAKSEEYKKLKQKLETEGFEIV